MLQGWQQVRSPIMPGLAFKDYEDHKSHCKQGLGRLTQLWEDLIVLFILHGSQTAIPSPTLIVNSSSEIGWQLHCLLPSWAASTVLLQPPLGQEVKFPSPSWQR